MQVSRLKLVTANRAVSILFNLVAGHQRGVYLVPANACPVIPYAILAAGGSVQFLDIDEKSLSLRQSDCEERIRASKSPAVVGIVFVRTYGFISLDSIDFPSLRKCSESLLLIDDRCAAVPETRQEELETSGADVYLYSTGYGKFADIGYGGYAFLDPSISYRNRMTNEVFDPSRYNEAERRWKELLARKKPLRATSEARQNIGWLDMRSLPLTEDKYMETIREQSVTAARQKQLAGDIYKNQIPEELFLGEGYNNWRQQILVENKSKVLETIFSRGYFASGHYDTTARLFSKASFPITDSFFSRTVNLFNDKYVDESSMIAVANIIKQHALRSSKRR